jgi:creatinine amidohydrolase
MACRADRRSHRCADLADRDLRYHPAFVEYAGSSALSAPVFEASIQEIATAILAFGCRALLVLDTGVSTLVSGRSRAGALSIAANVLHLRVHQDRAIAAPPQSLRGRATKHADELETSLMLALAPRLVGYVAR